MTTIENAKALVVEDEEEIRELMLLHLRRDGWNAVGVENAEAGEACLRNEMFDILVLDWMLPGMSGLDLCSRLAGKLPILMVTARAEAADIVSGLNAGADDYLVKPFELPVLLARAHALLRRGRGREASGKATFLTFGNLSIDLDKPEVRSGENIIPLTVSEFRLLLALVRNAGKVASRTKLIGLVQGEGVNVTERTIDTHVFGLRKKLGESGQLIETIRGVGYRISSN